MLLNVYIIKIDVFTRYATARKSAMSGHPCQSHSFRVQHIPKLSRKDIETVPEPHMQKPRLVSKSNKHLNSSSHHL